MKIALDVSPLETGHKVRGIGFYVHHLKDALTRYYPENDYLFFSTHKELRGNVDIIHYPYFDPFHKTFSITKKYPTVVTVHDVTPLIFPEHFPAGIKGKLNWFLQKQQIKKASAIITNSYASKEDILRLVKVKDNDITVIYLAAGNEFTQKKLAKERIEELRQKYRLPEQFALYVGDATWNKNLPRLVHAIKATNIPLVMVGKALTQQHLDKTNLWNKDLIKVQELSENDEQITRLGFVPTEDLLAIYTIATVFVYPSIYEGFGLPVLEAMQSGCPVIISKESCLPEVGGEAAFYFEGYDTISLSDAIAKVFTNKPLQEELIVKGIAQASKFAWKQTADQTVAVYKKVLSQQL